MFKCLCCVLFACLLVLPLAAQETAEYPWRAWLYNPDTGEIIQVAQDGAEVNRVTLPLAQAFNRYPPEIAVSPSGALVAYVVSDDSAENPNRALLVYNAQIGGVVASYALPPNAEVHTIRVNPNGQLFDEINQRIAFGYVLPDRAADPLVASWEIVIIDYLLGEVVDRLTYGDPGTDLVDPPLVIPTIMQHNNGRVDFLATFYTVGLPEYPAFTWDQTTREFKPNFVYNAASNDVLPATGEALIPTSDGRFAYAPFENIEPLPNFNAIHVYEPRSQSRLAVYTDPALVIGRGYFIEAGARILVTGIDPTVNTHVNASVVNRTGEVVTTLALLPATTLVSSTPDGFAYIEQSGAGVTLRRVTTIDNTFFEATLFTDPNPAISLVHIESDAPPVAYAPWVPLAPPISLLDPGG